MSVDPPPVPPVPHPEDVRVANERRAEARCPICQSGGALTRGENVVLGAVPLGLDVPREVGTRICRVCGYVALFAT